VGELRRLAPVADQRRVLIAVEQIGEGASRRLQIYGLIDVGMTLWKMARHERIGGTASPVCPRRGNFEDAALDSLDGPSWLPTPSVSGTSLAAAEVTGRVCYH
jgi:hypothetical protein